jgi:tetratricopeptide (TPR) repeat protein
VHRIGGSITVACGLVVLAASHAAGQGAAGVDHTAASPAQFDALVGLAKERLERALLIDEEDEDARRPLLAEAERYSRAAAELRPDEAEGWFLVAASIGLRSQYESMRQQVRLGAEIWELAATALERDPNHPGAHHVMGRLNLEAMELSGFGRMIATHLFGSQTLRRASWEQAESHLEKAAELEPALYHHLWLGRLYRARDREDEARAQYRLMLDMPASSRLDEIWIEEARKDLARLD